MYQESRSEPRFSRITVGGIETDGAPRLEEEEVITIGDVDVASASVEAADGQNSDNDYHGGTEELVETEDRIEETGSSEPDFDDLGADNVDSAALEPASVDFDDLGLNTPMPFAQKLVIVACLIGFAIAIAFLIWFWAF
jgi:hypothetical protein